MDEMFSYIEEEFSCGNFSWDYIKYFIQKAKYKDSKYISNYKPRIMQMLDKREINSFHSCPSFPWNGPEILSIFPDIISVYLPHSYFFIAF